jgi:hypothetical protein
MISVVLLILIVLLLAATPWRGLPLAGRFWAVAVLLNTLVFFSLPTTPATSPWRPVVQRTLAASAGMGLVLFAVGLILRKRQGTAPDIGRAWVGPLILGLLPAALYAFFLLIGPLY